MKKTFEVQGEEAFLSASWQWRRHWGNIPFLLSIDIDKPEINFLLESYQIQKLGFCYFQTIS